MSDWPPADTNPVPPGPPGPGWWLASDGKYYPPEQAPGQPVPPPPQYTAYSPYGAPLVQATSTNGLAIASMVLGILWLYWIGSVLALVFGYVAKGQIDRSAGRQTGRGMAIAVADDVNNINTDPVDRFCDEDRFLEDPDC